MSIDVFCITVKGAYNQNVIVELIEGLLKQYDPEQVFGLVVEACATLLTENSKFEAEAYAAFNVLAEAKLTTESDVNIIVPALTSFDTPADARRQIVAKYYLGE